MVGVSLVPVSNIQVYANYQNGFRNPTPMELYLFPSANENLDPEQVNSFEGGLIYLWAENNSWQISYYNNYVDSRIQNIRGQFTNSGSANQWGVESKIKVHLNSNVGTQISYSYLDPDIITAYNPTHQFKYALHAKHGKYLATVYGKYVSDLFADDYSQLPLPDYHVLNASLTLKSNYFNVHLRVLNILNRKYSIAPDFYNPGIAPNYEAPGTNAQIGIDFTF
jgi:iron complex outermembrane receptor protein